MSKRKPGLDIVRSAAILCVLAGHTIDWQTNGGKFLSWPLGKLGVEIFFALSGYLIGGILLKAIRKNGNRVDGALVREFWFRRWVRTVPNYLLFLVVFLFVDPGESRKWIGAYLTFTQNLAWKNLGFYGVSWSLAVEEWFYLSLPLLLLAFSQCLPRTRQAFIAATLVLLVVPPFLRMAIAPRMGLSKFVGMIVIFRLDSLMWGVIVACIDQYSPGLFRSLSRTYVFIAALLVTIALTVFGGWRIFIGGEGRPASWIEMMDFWIIGVSCALTLPLLSGVPTLPGFLATAVDRTSRWSYSLYLCHIPVLMLLGRAFQRFTHEGAAASNSTGLVEKLVKHGGLALGAWCLSFLVAWLVYQYFEQPILDWRDRHSERRLGPQLEVAAAHSIE